MLGRVSPPPTAADYVYKLPLPPPPAETKRPKKFQAVGSAPLTQEPQDYSAPPEDPTASNTDFPWYPGAFTASGIPEMAEITLPPDIEVHDYATRPPTSAPLGYR